VAIALWRLTPGQGWLALLLGNPVSLPITRLGYNLLAEVLYRWNKRRGHW
jgi:predicted DCC family thiol-disulfide oxidoreductase YuxK